MSFTVTLAPGKESLLVQLAGLQLAGRSSSRSQSQTPSHSRRRESRERSVSTTHRYDRGSSEDSWASRSADSRYDRESSQDSWGSRSERGGSTDSFRSARSYSVGSPNMSRRGSRSRSVSVESDRGAHGVRIHRDAADSSIGKKKQKKRGVGRSKSNRCKLASEETDLWGKMYSEPGMSELANMGLVNCENEEECKKLLRESGSVTEATAALCKVHHGADRSSAIALDILMGGHKLQKVRAPGQGHEARLALDEWTYAAIPPHLESSEFSVQVTNHFSDLLLAVELSIDGHLQEGCRRWAVKPGRTKVRNGTHGRYFANHHFRFSRARFVRVPQQKLGAVRKVVVEGEERLVREAAEGGVAEALPVIEEDEAAEQGMDECDDDSEDEEDPQIRLDALRRQGEEEREGGGGSEEAAASRLAQVERLGELRATEAVNRLQATDEGCAFREAMPGARVTVRCFVARWGKRWKRDGGGGDDMAGSECPQQLIEPALTATRDTAGIALSTTYGTPLSVTSSSGGNRLERAETPLATVELVYRRAADVPAPPVDSDSMDSGFDEVSGALRSLISHRLPRTVHVNMRTGALDIVCRGLGWGLA